MIVRARGRHAATVSPSVHDERSARETFGRDTQTQAANTLHASSWVTARGWRPCGEPAGTGARGRGGRRPSRTPSRWREEPSLCGEEICFYLRLQPPQHGEPDTTNRFIKSPLLRLCSHFIPPWKRHYTRSVPQRATLTHIHSHSPWMNLICTLLFPVCDYFTYVKHNLLLSNHYRN